MSAIVIAKNLIFHEGTKHIKLDYHLIREKLYKEFLKLLHVLTGQQLGDVFTKPHPPSSFLTFISMLGIHNVYAQRM